ncbi:MAG: TlpA family protein disulfide reductase [Phenylobacterium sp.]|uniref:TlpA family protein disulfide reductase n=1 Tax=Phenylobacterium sp. TaxID=1871053 RepID=UPI001A4C52F3|nr:TlpA disulfide reductase family protein [Phenylobacterium sp.]MBL8554383.1 TlpA family protein disulfide reductase [Phenylobacterium sp.]
MLDRRLLLAGLTVFAATPAVAAEKGLAGQPEMPGPLARYRDLSVKRVDGEASTLGRLLGPPRPAVVSFWATWCAPCALEGRRLARLRKAYPEERLAIVGINLDSHADDAKLDQFRRRAEMNYTQGLDGKALYLALSDSATVALPRTYVFDASGQPVAAFGRFFGERTLSAIDAAVRAAVASRPPARDVNLSASAFRARSIPVAMARRSPAP